MQIVVQHNSHIKYAHAAIDV